MILDEHQLVRRIARDLRLGAALDLLNTDDATIAVGLSRVDQIGTPAPYGGVSFTFIGSTTGPVPVEPADAVPVGAVGRGADEIGRELAARLLLRLRRGRCSCGPGSFHEKPLIGCGFLPVPPRWLASCVAARRAHSRELSRRASPLQAERAVGQSRHATVNPHGTRARSSGAVGMPSRSHSSTDAGSACGGGCWGMTPSILGNSSWSQGAKMQSCSAPVGLTAKASSNDPYQGHTNPKSNQYR